MDVFNRTVSIMLVTCMMLFLVACSTQETNMVNTISSTAETKVQENKPVLLTVSFGSSYNETLDLTIGALESALQSAYPEYEVRRAFTSQTVIDILEERDNIKVDNVVDAMDRLLVDNVRDVVVQPTHVMPGFEYDDLVEDIAYYSDKFDSIKIGDPLITSEKDYNDIVASLTEETAEYNIEDTAVVFMGHGTHHKANSTYSYLEKHLHDAGYTNYFVGTVEGSHLVDEVVDNVQATNAKKVVLLPLMIVAGDHANNDMAGDDEDSWKNVFINAGYEVECVLKGLGQYTGVQQILIDHAASAINE